MNETHSKPIRGGNAGFTLVELLLVVAILGILAGVVVVNVKGHGERARIGATRTSISAISTAVDAYEVTMSRLPTSLDQLTQSTDDAPAPLRADNLNDSWGNAFSYKKKGKYEFEVRSAGADGAMGSGDDITN
jgi:general secretion pathway protein G